MSLDTVELLVAIEKKFDILILDQEAENIITIGDFYPVVWQHISNKSYQQTVAPYTREAMEKAINQIISDQTGVDLKEISPEKSLTDDLGID